MSVFEERKKETFIPVCISLCLDAWIFPDCIRALRPCNQRDNPPFDYLQVGLTGPDESANGPGSCGLADEPE